MAMLPSNNSFGRRQRHLYSQIGVKTQPPKDGAGAELESRSLETIRLDFSANDLHKVDLERC